MRRSIGLAILVASVLFGLGAAPARALDPTRGLRDFHHTAWTAREGMPVSVRAIEQTADGFLWLGTGSGVYRFDGLHVERVERFGSARLPLVEVHAMEITSDGDLWIGFAGNVTTIVRVRRGVMTTYTEADGLPANGVTQLVADNRGGLWMRSNGDAAGGFSDRLAYFDGRSWRQVEGPWGSMSQDIMTGVWDYVATGDGTVWAKNGSTLYYFRAGMQRFEAAPGYSGQIVGFALAPDGRGWTADGAARRFYSLPDLSGAARATIPPPLLQGAVPPGVFGNIYIDRDGTLWCLNEIRGGINRTRSFAAGPAELPEVFNADDGLSSNSVIAFFEDREGNVWIGTEAGLDRFRPADVVLERRVPLTLLGPSLVSATQEALYVYTGHGRGSQSSGSVSAIYRIAGDGEPRRVAESVGDITYFELHGNDLSYVSSPSSGGGERRRFMLRNGERVERIAFPPTASPAQDLGRILVAHGASWYARPRLGYFSFRDGRETQVIAKTDVAIPPTAWLWRDRVLVLYADGAFYEIVGDEVREHRVPDIGQARPMAWNDRRVLFGAQQGLLEWNGEQFRTVSASRAPALAVISDIALTQGGEAWFATPAGAVRATEADLERALADPQAQLPVRLFDTRDGFTGAISGDMHVGPDGRLWFATLNGLAWLDPNRIARNVAPPPVAITLLTAGERTYEMPANLRLPPGSSNLEIDYTALSLTVPERNRFRYRLEGVDTDWVDAGDRREAFYTRLEPGAYLFRVIAANNDGVWNEEGATLSFTIAPTFLQSIWFKFLLALALVAMAWGAYTMRLRQEEARLQSRFEVRIAERERIARELHDTLLQGFQGLMLRFQAIVNRAPEGEELRNSLSDALDRADAVLVEGRARVRELRARDVEGDLAKAIVENAHKAIENDTPEFRLTVEGTPRTLHVLVNEEVTRIADEAVRNAVQHAHAKRIEAILSYGGRELRLIIRDDGVGMPEAVMASGERAGHYGLVGMRERAARIGGRLEVSSREGAGTEIALSLPSRAAYNDGRVRLGNWLRPTRSRNST